MTPSSSFYETPYIYALNRFDYMFNVVPGALAGSVNDVIKSDGDSAFFARRAVGPYNFQDADSNYFIKGTGRAGAPGWTANGQDYPLAPEKLYPLGSDIQFQSAADANGKRLGHYILSGWGWLPYEPPYQNLYVVVTTTMFQGAKRYAGAPDSTPTYRYREVPFAYSVKFNLNWLFIPADIDTVEQVVPAPYQTFYQKVLDYDFELWSIETGFDFNNASVPGASGYMLRMYDANSRWLMSDFVHIRQLSTVGGYSGGSAATPGNQLSYFPNCFPAPPVLYQKGSVIQFDVLSLLDPAHTAAQGDQLITFRGVRRIPCA